MNGQKAKAVSIEGAQGFQRLLSGVPETCGMKAGCVRLKPGDSVGVHSTGEREEAIVVLEGELKLVLDKGEEISAAARSLVYVPPFTTHDMKNAGLVDSVHVYVVSPVPGDVIKKEPVC